MKTFFPTIKGIAAGTLISWLPYGYATLPVFLILTSVFLIRRVIDHSYRGNDKDNRRMNFFVLFWIAIAFFFMKPSGLNTNLSKMNYKNVKVGYLLRTWKKELPNITFICEKRIAERRMSINTITPITVTEALSLIDEKTGTIHTYSQENRGRSIAGGPRIVIRIKPGEIGTEKESGKQYIDIMQQRPGL